MKLLHEELQALKESNLYRTTKKIDSAIDKEAFIDGKKYLVFCSNNYLGLANHPIIIKETKKAVDQYGSSAGSSRLICGTHTLHEKLENEIARFKGYPKALVFPTGYMTNIGIFQALLNEQDCIIMDRLNHASLIDGSRLSRAKLFIYPHKNMQKLEQILQKTSKYRRRLIVTDSVFSMDGDIAPLPQIVELAKKYDGLTMIDEAHATGVLGKNGKGALEYFGLKDEVNLVMGTFSKALGSLGGFVCGSEDLIDFLLNKARSFIYTTALPPHVCAASLAALEIVQDEPEIREALWKNVRYFSEKSETQIIPIVIGDAEKTKKIADQLFDNGILLSAIRPPTVPKNTSRLRISIMAKHTKDDIDILLGLLDKLTL